MTETNKYGFLLNFYDLPEGITDLQVRGYTAAIGVTWRAATPEANVEMSKKVTAACRDWLDTDPADNS